MDEALREFINAIKDLSPAVWEAALVRVQVQGWLDLASAGLSLTLAILFTYGTKVSLVKADDDDDNDAWVGGIFIFGILAIVATIVTVGNLYYGLLYLLSPDWSAIQLILEQVR